MLDLRRLRDDPDAARAALARRRDPALDGALTEVLDLDRRRRDLLARAEAIKAERNAASEEVARLKRSGGDATALVFNVDQEPAIFLCPSPQHDAPADGCELEGVVQQVRHSGSRAS